MFKQIVIFMALFLLSSTLTIIFNDNVAEDQLFESTLYITSIIDTDIDIIIHSEYNENIDYNMNDEELSAFAESRIRVIESTELTDTIEIYTVNLYGEIVENSVITITSNEITILSDLGQLSTYRSLTFVPYAQFDSSYMQGAPYIIYEIHIPEGLGYSID